MSKPRGASISTQSPLPPTKRPLPCLPARAITSSPWEWVRYSSPGKRRSNDRNMRGGSGGAALRLNSIATHARAPRIGAVTAMIAVRPSEGSALPKAESAYTPQSAATMPVTA